jgi:hypothetical protein
MTDVYSKPDDFVAHGAAAIVDELWKQLCSWPGT